MNCVKRIQMLIENDRHHKLREGHDLASLLGKDKEKRVYPWPTATNCPLKNAEWYESRAQRKRQRKINLTSKSLEEQEVGEAISSIEMYNLAANNPNRDNEQAPVVDDGDVFMSMPNNSNVEVTVTTSVNHEASIQSVAETNQGPMPDSTLNDEDIDPQAFETLRQKTLNWLGPLGFSGTGAEKLSPR